MFKAKIIKEREFSAQRYLNIECKFPDRNPEE